MKILSIFAYINLLLLDDMHRYFVDCTVTVQTYIHKDRQECVLILVTLAFPSNVCSISTHSRNFFRWRKQNFPTWTEGKFLSKWKESARHVNQILCSAPQITLIIKHNNRHILLQHIPAFYIYMYHCLSVCLFFYNPML